MSDMEIGALRKKLVSRPRSDDYRQRRKDMDARALEYKIAPDVSDPPLCRSAEHDLKRDGDAFEHVPRLKDIER